MNYMSETELRLRGYAWSLHIITILNDCMSAYAIHLSKSISLYIWAIDFRFEL